MDIHTAKSRSVLIQKIRDFFVNEGFLEVETPIMTPIPGMEPHLTPFETELNFQNLSDKEDSSTSTNSFITNKSSTQPSSISRKVFLNTSPELQMKKLLGYQPESGNPEDSFDKIFNITKVFRNGEMNSPLHNPEFTMLEWYGKNADYIDLMSDCENLILELVKINRSKSPDIGELQAKINPSQDSQAATPSFTYQSEIINLSTPWPRYSTNELFQKYCDIDLLKNRNFETFKKTAEEFAEKKDLQTSTIKTTGKISIPPFSSGCENWDDLYFKIFLNYIEPELAKLNQPIFIYDYPASQAALAKKCQNDPQKNKNPFFAERFELYIKGIEFANAFSELTDSNEQRERLIEEQQLRKKLGKTIFKIDEEFLAALDHIIATTAGIALGLDRLIMLLLDKKSIEEVMLFPMTSLANPPSQR